MTPLEWLAVSIALYLAMEVFLTPLYLMSLKPQLSYAEAQELSFQRATGELQKKLALEAQESRDRSAALNTRLMLTRDQFPQYMQKLRGGTVRQQAERINP